MFQFKRCFFTILAQDLVDASGPSVPDASHAADAALRIDNHEL